MGQEESLLPPRSVLFERMTRNVRERKVLETLLKLSAREEDWERESQRTASPDRTRVQARGV
jgi:hypothetical protein